MASHDKATEKLVGSSGKIYLSIARPAAEADAEKAAQKIQKSGPRQLLALILRVLPLQLRQGFPPPTSFPIYVPIICFVVFVPVLFMLIIKSFQECAAITCQIDDLHTTSRNLICPSCVCCATVPS